jgi:DNA-binding HxlR family transcriptional regulator
MGLVTNRTYEQYCPVAAALDVLGDRWTLLVLRELLFGEQRFTDLRRALPGMAPNLLSARLRVLEDEGFVERRELPPPAARTVYAATPAAHDVIPVLRALARFGSDRLDPVDGGDVVRPEMAVFGMVAPFHRPDPAAPRQHTRLVLDGEAFDLLTDGERLSARARPDDHPDLVITAPASAVVRARQSGTALGEVADVRGPRSARREFERRFGLRV